MELLNQALVMDVLVSVQEAGLAQFLNALKFLFTLCGFLLRREPILRAHLIDNKSHQGVLESPSNLYHHVRL